LQTTFCNGRDDAGLAQSWPRIGTPELVRWGVDMQHVDRMADLIAEALSNKDPSAMAPRVRDVRGTFDTLHLMN
jgi:glycine hydroxymethyltransferase